MFVPSNEPTKPTHIRYSIVAMLFLASAYSYGDRVVLSIAGIAFSKDLHLNPVMLGYLFSGFSWAYVVAQLPAGGLLDRFGCKNIYAYALLGCAACALGVGASGYLPLKATVAGLAIPVAFAAIMAFRLLSGLVQAPVFPGNGRIVTAWFPTAERGTASAIFNSSQYFALVFFAPIMGWVTVHWGWKTCFWLLGALGVVLVAIWFRVIYGVDEHPRINPQEAAHIEKGGGLTTISGNSGKGSLAGALTWKAVCALLSNKMLVGIYIGQFCIVTLTWFFLTWFPLYLSKERHMSILKVGIVAALPALCGSVGGILGGVVSDRFLRMGRSLTFARKTPIVTGMTLSMLMIVCNYVNTQWLIILLMSVAFFGKGFGALGWTVISDTSPKGMIGLNGGVFNLIGNMAGITTPIIIGYIVQRTGSFHDALLFVAGVAVLAIVAYLPIVGQIRRLERSDLFGPEAS
jgi:MFS transporter, ACS family, glucarate transporter